MKHFQLKSREHMRASNLTRARARCASKDRRARETREQRQTRARGARASRASTARALVCRRARARAHFGHARSESLFARSESLCELICTRARVSECARLSLLAQLARARVKCSRAHAAHPAAGEAPYMNSYVLNQANVYMSYLYDWHMFTIWLHDHLCYYSK